MKNSKTSIPSYAVVFTYSFDLNCCVCLFNDEKAALDFLATSFAEEVRIDVEENEWDCESNISDDGRYARIVNHFGDRDDVT